METIDQLLKQRLAAASKRLHIDHFLFTFAVKVICELSDAGIDYQFFDKVIGRTLVSCFSEVKRMTAENGLQQDRNVAEATEVLQAVEGIRFEELETLKELIHKAPEDGLIRKYHLFAIGKYHDALSSFVNLHGDRSVSEFVLHHCAEDIAAIKDLWLMREFNYTEQEIFTAINSIYDEN